MLATRGKLGLYDLLPLTASQWNRLVADLQATAVEGGHEPLEGEFEQGILGIAEMLLEEHDPARIKRSK